LQQQPDMRGRRQRQCVPQRLGAENGSDGVGDGVALERDAARQHLVQHTAECPDVGPLVDELSPRLFGAHVGGRAEDHAVARAADRDRRRMREIGARFLNGSLGQPEVQHLDDAGRRHFDVRRLEVAMHDAFFVRRRQPSHNLLAIIDSPLNRDKPTLKLFP